MEEDQKENRVWKDVFEFSGALSAGWGFQVRQDARFAIEIPSKGDVVKSRIVNSVDAFLENRQRMTAMSHLPMLAFNHGRRFHHLDILFGSRESKSVRLDEDEQSNGEFYKFEMMFRDWVNGKIATPNVAGVTDYLHVASLVAFDQNRASPAADSFCGALIIQSWSIFETLSEQLWVDAVNAHPSRLARLQGRPRSAYKVDPNPQNSQQTKKNDGKSVSISSMEKYGFRVENRLGDILRDTERVTFRSLPLIRESYHRAFDEEADQIDAVLDDPSLQYCAAVRNVLIHKAGRVDKEYLDQVTNVQDAVRPNIGERFPLTGQIAANLCDWAMMCSQGLIVAVHRWLIDRLDGKDE